ncbi:MAG TPA: hypothetical protein VFF52_22515, partial [Isosphaeraceae bacterium]|nr:hypothetical protein [Isosphaeraceae bacterium]
MQWGGGSSLSGSPAFGAQDGAAAARQTPSGSAAPRARDPGVERLAITIVPPPRVVPGSGGALPDVPQAQPAAPRVVKPTARDDADLIATLGAEAPRPASPSGLTAPWHPASRPGGGTALPTRGGSGNGAQPATVAAVQGHVPAAPAPTAPAAPAAIPGVLSGPGAQSSSAPSFPPPTITRNAAAQQLAGSTGAAGSVSSPAGTTTTAAGTGANRIAENPSSLPSSSVGNGPGAPLTFQYFPLYIVDVNNGLVLFNNQYQLANQGGTVDLEAQVKGTTVSSYSWTVNGATNVTGARTYHVHFQWQSSFQAVTNAVTLTVTNSSSQQETQTVYFDYPGSNSVTLPTSSSWPVTFPPDQVEPGAPSISSQGVTVDADSGALDSQIALPSYNPNVPALALTYNSLTADPRPIIVVHHTLDPTQSVPTTVAATLTF